MRLHTMHLLRAAFAAVFVFPSRRKVLCLQPTEKRQHGVAAWQTCAEISLCFFLIVVGVCEYGCHKARVKESAQPESSEYPTQEQQLLTRFRVGMTEEEAIKTWGRPMMRLPNEEGGLMLIYLIPGSFYRAHTMSFCGWQVWFSQGRATKLTFVHGFPLAVVY